MARTATLGALAAIVLAWSWLQLERAPDLRALVVWSVVLGVLPALAARPGWRLAAVALAAPLAIREALGTVSPTRAVERFGDGFVAYYDVGLPFAWAERPLMHGLIELAVFSFTLAVSLAVASRRPLLASGLLVAGAGWPATLLQGEDPFVRGVVILGTALAIVAGVNATLRTRQAAIAGAVVVVCAVAVASIPAVAKGAFLAWEKWDPYTRDDVPVSVEYVWTTNFNPLTWPKKKTVVLRIKAPPVSRYWRATTLNQFHGRQWLEITGYSVSPEQRVDPLLPDAAHDSSKWFRARVKTEALEDTHLIGASMPVAYQTSGLGPILYQDSGTASVIRGVPRGATYTSFSYAARPSPQRLARSRPIYPALLDPYLVVQSQTQTPPSPPFGSAGRAAEMQTIFAENPRIGDYTMLYGLARRIVGETTSPYLATVRLEDHFRRGSNYRYEESPPRPPDGVDPIIDFVTRTHAGHCQYFASTMALMLRYLGIPSRVAAGFTSGRYDQKNGEWVVVDHDAHTWVEVWFRGFGWLPFDPTPGRGTLDGAWTSASAGFSLQAVTAALAAGQDAADLKLDRSDFERDGVGRIPARDVPGDVGVAASKEEPSLLRLLLLVALSLLVGVSVLKLALRRARFLTRDPRRIAGACRRELADFLSDQRLAVPASATLAELGEIVRHEIGLNAEPFVDAVEAARYGPPAQALHAARQAKRELRRLERELRRRLSAWERARGVVSLRSLGLT